MATHEDLAWIQNPKFELDDKVKKRFQETSGDIFQSTFRSGQDNPWDDICMLWFLTEAYNLGPVFERRESIDQAPWNIQPHYRCPVTKSLHDTGSHRSEIRIVEFFPHGFTIQEAELIFGRDLDLGEIAKPDRYSDTVFWSLNAKPKWEDLSHEERMASEAFGEYSSDRKQLNCTKNAILMGHRVSHSFSHAKLALIPINDNDWKIVDLIQLSCKNHNPTSPVPDMRDPLAKDFPECRCTSWQDPDEQPYDVLKWHSSFRPSRNFVFWHYLVALFKTLKEWQYYKRKGLPCAEIFCVPKDRQWPNNNERYIRRVAIEMLTQLFDVDYNIIAEIVEPHVFWEDAISGRSAEEMVKANEFYSKFAGWLYASKEYRFH